MAEPSRTLYMSVYSLEDGRRPFLPFFGRVDPFPPLACPLSSSDPISDFDMEESREWPRDDEEGVGEAEGEIRPSPDFF